MDDNEKEDGLSKKIKRMMKQNGWDKMSEEELMDAVSAQLEVMVNLDMIEQLIGEDGNFYYRPNPDGKFLFSCPKCRHKMKLPCILIGSMGRCPSCSRMVFVSILEDKDE
jgi:hypothetical protein